MSKPERMQRESSGWVHTIPVQPSERKTIWGAVWVFAAIGLVVLMSGTLNEASLVLLAVLVGVWSLLPRLFRATRPKVNICPTCNVRTTYNPYQKVCGRCGHRP